MQRRDYLFGGKLPKCAGLLFQKLLHVPGPIKPAMGYRKACDHKEDEREKKELGIELPAMTNLHRLLQQACLAAACFSLDLRLLACCRGVRLSSVSRLRPESDYSPGSIFPWAGLAHTQINSEWDYDLKPEGWEGYLETWSQLYVVSCNSNKRDTGKSFL